MKPRSASRIALNALLIAAFVASLALAAVLPRMQALIPTFTAVASAIGLVGLNTDHIRYYR